MWERIAKKKERKLQLAKFCNKSQKTLLQLGVMVVVCDAFTQCVNPVEEARWVIQPQSRPDAESREDATRCILFLAAARPKTNLASCIHLPPVRAERSTEDFCDTDLQGLFFFYFSTPPRHAIGSVDDRLSATLPIKYYFLYK